MDDFRIAITFDAGVATVGVAGDLDAATAPILDEGIRRLDADGAGPVDVVVNLADVPFIDSSGLSVLVATHKRLRDRGGSLAVEGPSATARRLFAIAGLDQVLVVRD